MTKDTHFHVIDIVLVLLLVTTDFAPSFSGSILTFIRYMLLGCSKTIKSLDRIEVLIFQE